MKIISNTEVTLATTGMMTVLEFLLFFPLKKKKTKEILLPKYTKLHIKNNIML